MPPLLAPVLTLAFCLAVQGRAVDVSVPTLGPPVLVAEIDTSKVKGDARRLAFIQKSGRKTPAISWIAVGRSPGRRLAGWRAGD